MSTTPEDQGDGVASLTTWLGKIAEAEVIDDLDPKFHSALRSHAASLHGSDRSFQPTDLAAVDSSTELSALSAAAHLRSLEVVAFWQPLLKHCLTGRSTAPLADLQSSSREAQVLVEALSKRPAGPVRDEVLRLATEAEERTSKWLPRSPAGPAAPTAATRYSRGTFERNEDEDGNPIERPPPEPREKPPPKDSPLRVALGWLATAGAIAAIAFGVWAYSQRAPEPLPLSHYQAFVSDATGKTIEGSELVLTVAPAWEQKAVAVRAAELERLVTGRGTTDSYESVRVVDASGAILARKEPGAEPSWATESPRPGAAGLRADQLGDRDEFEAPPSAEGEDKAEGDRSDGTLKRPLRADEIPLDDVDSSP